MNSFKNVITVLNLRKFAPISHQKQSAGGLLKNKKHKALKTRNINPLFGWPSARALAKALFTVVLSLNLCSVTLAQDDFGDPVIYTNNTATVYGVVTINDQPAELGDVVGFFVESELRFKGPVVVFGGKAYVTGLMNAAGGNEVFTFKVYDDSAKAVYPVPGISLTVGPGSTTGPTPLFEIKASSGPGLEEQLAQMTAARDAAIAERDARPTQAALDAAVVESRAAGQGDVTTDPAKYNLVTQTSYDTVVVERDARPTQAALDAAVVESRTTGQGDVTTDPAKYNLVTQTSYDTVVVERDARPTQAALDAAVVESRTAGQGDVTTDPAKYNLVTQTSYNTVVAERDARFADADGDGLTDIKETELETDPANETTFYLTGAYDEAVASAIVKGRGEVTANPQNFNLISAAAYAGVEAERDARFADADGDGLTDVKETELQTNPANETTFYLTGAYDDAVASALVKGRGEVTANPQNFDLISGTTYEAVVAERNTNLATYTAALAEKDRTVVALNGALIEKDGAIKVLNDSITEKDAAYNALVAASDGDLDSYTAALAEKDGVIATLNGSIAEKDEAIKVLKDSIVEKDAANAILVTERDANLATYTAALTEKDGTITTLNESVAKNVVDYQTVVAERDANLLTYTAALAEKDGVITTLNGAITEKDGTITTLNGSIAEKDGAIEILNDSIVEKDAANAALVSERDANLVTYTEALTEKDGAITTLNESIAKNVEDYQTVVAERDANLVTYTAALAEKDGVITTLNGAITEKDGTIATLNDSIVEKDAANAALVSERDANLVTYTAALAEKDGTITTLNESVAKNVVDYQTVVAERDADLVTYTAALAEKDGVITTLNGSIAEKDGAIEILNDSIVEKDAANAILVIERDANLVTYTAALAEKDGVITTLNGSIAEKGGVIKTLNDSIVEKDAANAILVTERDANLVTYTAALAEKDGVITTLNESVAKNVVDYQTVVAERDANLVTYTAALAEKDGVITTLNGSIAEKDGAIKTLNDSITEKDAAYNALVAASDGDLDSYTAALAEKDGVITTLNGAITEKDGTIATLNESIVEKDAANAILVSERDANLATYTAALAEKDGAITTLNESITEKDAANTALITERDANLATYTAALAEKDGAITTLNESITEKDAANTALITERDTNLATYTASLTEKDGTIATLNESIAKNVEDYQTVVAERDANLVTYTAALAEKDEVITTLNGAITEKDRAIEILNDSIVEKDAANATLVTERDANLATYTAALTEKDGVITTLNDSIVEKDAANAALVTERDANLVTYTAALAEKDGAITTLNESITEKDAANTALITERDTNLATYTASLTEKDGTIATLNESIAKNVVDYQTVVAERDANLVTYTAALAEKDEVITTLNGAITEKDRAIEILNDSIVEKDAANATLVTERDANLATYTAALTEKDGVITTLNDSIVEKDAANAALVTERDANLVTYTAALAEKDGAITTLNESITEKDAANTALVAERDARFLDTDADGITDIKEAEIETDPNVGTVFYLDNTEFEIAVANARETGQRDVILNPLSYGLVSSITYETVVSERDARFLDTDEDGLTDVKEVELETDFNVETRFYLQRVYDNAVATSSLEGRQAGRSDVTGNPGNFNLTTVAAYNVVIAERDARPTQVAYDALAVERDTRFLDTDEDGLTDVKELELDSDLAVETNFYLQGAYDNAVTASKSEGRQAGRNEVTGNPDNFNLKTVAAYNVVIAERDARPTQVAYDALAVERDARFLDADEDGLTDVKELELDSDPAVETNFYLQGAYDNAVATSKSEGRQAGRSDVTGNPGNFNLTTFAAYNLVIAERDARPTQVSYDAIVAERDARFVDTDEDGITDLKEIELKSDSTVATNFYLQGVYDNAVATSKSEGRQAGRSDVTGNPGNFDLTTVAAYNLVIAERDARPTQVSYDAIVAERDIRFLDTDEDGLTDVKELELESDSTVATSFYLQGAYDNAVAASKSEGRQAGRNEVTGNPDNFNLKTTASYAAVVAERDARFLDSDQDGLTDLKEEELESDGGEETTFYLKSAYDSAVTTSRVAGRSEVTTNPQNFSLIKRDAYDSVVAERDARFLDSDQDGLTDEKEIELGVSISEKTNFYLQGAFDEIAGNALDDSLEQVTANPQNYGFASIAAYNAVVAERDSRFVDTDRDGLTDQKENELATSSTEATTFYLKSAYDSVIAESLQVGRDEVVENPQNFALTSNTAYNNVVSQRDARFADSDEDGLTDVIEAELETDPNRSTLFSILESPSNFKIAFSQTTGDEDDDFVIAEATTEDDQLFADSDLDGITDAKEEELNTNRDEQTTFYVKSSYDSAVAASRVAGRNDITTNPQNYGLTTTTAYQAVIAERDARFIDTDRDGLTDTKEVELATNASEQTTFYLQGFFDNAVSNSRQSGRSEVTSNPQNYDLTTTSSYDEVVAQRDARFVDSDQDGLTDLKEIELSSDSTAETSFYLQGAYDTAVAEALQSGSDSVTNNPSNYNLTSITAYDAVVAQRDARPTLDAFNAITEERDARFVDTDKDGLTDTKEIELETDSTVGTIFYLQGAYNNAVATSNSQGRQAGRSDVTGTPGNFNLTTVEAYNIVVAERDARPTQNSYDAILAERDARFIDTDEDGITDLKEIDLETDLAVETTFYLQGTYDDAVAASNTQGRQVGRLDVTENLGDYSLTTVEAYNTAVAERDARPTQNSYDAILAERDARFIDTDEDGITDLKELELETDLAVETTFYLQGAYDDAVAASNTQGRQVGRLDVTENLGDYSLTTVEAYNTAVAERDARPTQNSYDAILAERDARFVDTDEDGLTDVKEIELETDLAVETVFYLQGAYDNAVVSSNSLGRQAGRTDVTGSPGDFNLTTVEAYNTAVAERDARPTQTSYDAILAERDARFVDTDEDGLTDVKEIELETDLAVETVFYLQGAYDNAVVSSNSLGRQAGRTDVTGSPGNFNLTTIEAYNTVIAERDARPTQVAYDALAAERDARFVDTDQDGLTDVKEIELETDVAVETGFYLQGAYDAAVSASNLQGRQTGRLEVGANPASFNLTTLEAYNTVVAERDARFLDTDEDGLTDSKEIELETDATFETRFYLQRAYDSAVSASNLQGRQTGRLEVGANPASFNLTTLEAYNTVVAERDARFLDTDEDGLTDVKEAELESDNNELTPFYLQDAYELGVESARFEGRTDVTNNPNAFSLVSNAQYNFVVAQRDARPTRDAYDTVVEERDARPTLGEVKDARLGSVVLQPDNGNNRVKIRFSIEETDDLKVWTKRDEVNEVTVPLELGSKFYRFSLQDE